MIRRRIVFAVVALCVLAAPAFAFDALFDARIDYHVAAAYWNPDPRSICAADFDGDGRRDLAVALPAGDYISVLMNNGDGTFSVVDYKMPPVTWDAYALCAADLDGDGDVDLAIANNGFDAVNILLNNGDGTFPAPTKYTTGDGPAAICAADFDGDGDVDLATPNCNSDNVSILKGDGSGAFTAPVNFAVGDNPRALCAVDVDGDGDADLAVANYGSDSYNDNVSILKNNGDGTFASASSCGVGDRPSSICSVDIDGDGDGDLAVTNYGSDSVAILKNDGNGNFVLARFYTVGMYPTSVVMTDLSGDGFVDMAVANEYNPYGSDIMIFHNDGTGAFASAVRYGVGDAPASMCAADFDGDGKRDLATANSGAGTVSILENEGAGTFPDVAVVSFEISTRSACVADFDDDGDDDLAAVTSPSLGQVSIFRNNGDGTFAAGLDYEAYNAYALCAADLDGDGDIDIAVAGSLDLYSDNVGIMENNGDGTFVPIVLHELAVGSEPRCICAADFDGDGDNDLAVADTYYDSVLIMRNNGHGSFPTSESYAVGDYPYYFSAADVDGDGDVDLAVANAGDDNVSILVNDGDGGFAAAVNYAAGEGPYSVWPADLDGDGDIDLATANEYSDNVSILLNDGGGSFAAPVHCPVGDQPRFACAADFDGDGDNDLVAANLSTQDVSFLANNGDGTFASPVHYGTENLPLTLCAADFDGDSDVDLAAGCESINILFNVLPAPTHVDPISRTPRSAIVAVYPNPFNPSVTIDLLCPSTDLPVEVAIFDVLGRKVRTVFAGRMDALERSFVWDGKSDSGRVVSSGVYFCRVRAGSEINLKKIILLR